MSMSCPQCNHPLLEPAGRDGPAHCSNCGWARRSSIAAEQGGSALQAGGGPRLLFLRLVLGWLLTLALVLGPYIALWVYLPDAAFWVHLVYWMIAFIYVASAATITPRYDPGNMGWFGGLMDNPFSFEDDLNRMGLFFAVILLPGQAIVWTLAATWRLVRGT